MKATITVEIDRGSGTTITKRSVVESSHQARRESKATFADRVEKAALAAVRAVTK